MLGAADACHCCCCWLRWPLLTDRFEHRRQAFSCYVFQDGRGWLIADVDIECYTEEHETAMALGWIAIIVYPIGLWVINAALLYASRNFIRVQGSKPTVLSRAARFLYREYTPEFFWWELVPLRPRPFLVSS